MLAAIDTLRSNKSREQNLTQCIGVKVAFLRQESTQVKIKSLLH